MTILAILLLAASLSIILVPALLKNIELSHDAIEYEALIEQAKIMNTEEPRTPDLAELSESNVPDEALISEVTPTAFSIAPLPSETPSAPVITATRNPSSGENSGHRPSSPTSDSSPNEPNADEQIKLGNTGADLSLLYAKNNDFIAWLQIPGTKVDFPVVLTDDVDYYLNHLFTGKESSLGTLFSLGKTDYSTPSRNIAIYGHNVRSTGKQMFAALTSYKKQSYYETHQIVYLDTLYHASIYHIFAVIDMKHDDWDASVSGFSTEQDFLAFIDRAKTLSLYDTGVEVSAEDHILTLITCDREYGGKDGRLVIMAVEQ